MFTRSGSRFAAPRGMLAPFVTFALFMTVVGGTLAVNDPVSLPHEPAELAAGVPVAVSGTLLGVVDGHLAVREDGATAPVAFPLATVAHVARGGDASSVEALRPGDELRLSVDATTGRVLRIDAAPVAAVAFAPSDELALLAAIGFVSGGVLLAARNRRPQAATPATERGATESARRAAFADARNAMARAAGVSQPSRVGARS